MKRITLTMALWAGLGSMSMFGQSTDLISPSQPIPKGKAPGMETKLVSESPQQKVYTIIFHKGDDALSGLTDFAIRNHIQDAHFTGIGAVSSATLGWLDLDQKGYRPILVKEQSEVLSLIGDVAAFQGTPTVHAHTVLGGRTGQTTGGHVWSLTVNPTLEVFMTVDTTPLAKKLDPASGMKLIDPAP